MFIGLFFGGTSLYYVIALRSKINTFGVKRGGRSKIPLRYNYDKMTISGLYFLDIFGKIIIDFSYIHILISLCIRLVLMSLGYCAISVLSGSMYYFPCL